MTGLVIVSLIYVLATVFIIWWFTRRLERQEEEARVERRELTDRVMALSSKPESLAAIGRDEEGPAAPRYVGEDTPWHEVAS